MGEIADVRTMKLDSNPAWAPITMFSVNLLKARSHTHGNKRFYKAEGPTFVTFDDAVTLFHRVERYFDGLTNQRSDCPTTSAADSGGPRG